MSSSDEAIRRMIHTGGHTLPNAPGRRHTVALDRDESLRLLAGAPFGRIVFTQQALPAIRPVGHLLDDGRLIVRTHKDAALSAHARSAGARGAVVAYQADEIDPGTRRGWSVVVTGYCHLVTDAADIARYTALLHPWPDGRMDHVVRIQPDLITGVRLVGAD